MTIKIFNPRHKPYGILSNNAYYPIDIKGKKWRTRGMKSCKPGKWRVDILAPDGETVYKSHELEIQKRDAAEEAQEGESI